MSQLTDSSVLPLYTISEPLPVYSNRPSREESTLQHTHLRQVRTKPTGTYVKRSGRITVTLHEQENGLDMPVYGRNGEVAGSILIEDPHKVSQVTIKIEGTLNTTISSVYDSVPLISRSYTLWRKGDAHELPDSLAFSDLLPSTFTYDGSENPLPPTYHEERFVPAIFSIQAKYSITIGVSWAGFLSKSDRVKIPFKYHPRNRAHRPVLTSPGFFSSIATSPEEWYQSSATMQTREPMSNLGAIQCDLFVPSVRVYALSDKIPFYIQLNGPLEALQKLVPQLKDAPPSSLLSRLKFQGKYRTTPSIKAHIMRHSYVKMKESPVPWRNGVRLAECQIWELPPAFAESRGAANLNWGGEIRLGENVAVGGFTAGNVAIKDSIVISVEPPTIDRRPSPFVPVEISVQIRFVTESYMEVVH